MVPSTYALPSTSLPPHHNAASTKCSPSFATPLTTEVAITASVDFRAFTPSKNILPNLGWDWWQNFVINNLTEAQLEQVNKEGKSKLEDLDVAALLRITVKSWREINLYANLPNNYRRYVSNMIDVRNKWFGHNKVEISYKDKKNLLKSLGVLCNFFEKIINTYEYTQDINDFKNYIKDADFSQEIEDSSFSEPLIQNLEPYYIQENYQVCPINEVEPYRRNIENVEFPGPIISGSKRYDVVLYIAVILVEFMFLLCLMQLIEPVQIVEKYAVQERIDNHMLSMIKWTVGIYAVGIVLGMILPMEYNENSQQKIYNKKTSVVLLVCLVIEIIILSLASKYIKVDIVDDQTWFFGLFGNKSLVEQGNSETVTASIIIGTFFNFVIGMALIVWRKRD